MNNLKNADLTAREGMIYTNGNGVFANQIWLGSGDKAENWHEITEAEYSQIVTEQEVDV